MTAEDFRAMVGADRPSTLPDQCAWAGLPVPVAEYHFARPRRWRFDWAWPERKVAVDRTEGYGNTDGTIGQREPSRTWRN
jgi:hypothetical protein